MKIFLKILACAFAPIIVWALILGMIFTQPGYPSLYMMYVLWVFVFGLLGSLPFLIFSAYKVQKYITAGIFSYKSYFFLSCKICGSGIIFYGIIYTLPFISDFISDFMIHFSAFLIVLLCFSIVVFLSTLATSYLFWLWHVKPLHKAMNSKPESPPSPDAAEE